MYIKSSIEVANTWPASRHAVFKFPPKLITRVPRLLFKDSPVPPSPLNSKSIREYIITKSCKKELTGRKYSSERARTSKEPTRGLSEKWPSLVFSTERYIKCSLYTKNSLKTIVIGLNKTMKDVETIHGVPIVASSRQLHKVTLQDEVPAFILLGCNFFVQSESKTPVNCELSISLDIIINHS